MTKKIRKITILACVILLAFASIASAESLRVGSKGADVRKVQSRLIQYGYMEGSATGNFGAKTKAAVIKFQRKYGLKQDGIVGKGTAAKLGVTLSGSGGSTKTSSKNSNDVNLLARVVHGEARGEPYKGKVAVAAVVLNRVKHPSFPNTISGVVYQKSAFSVVNDGQINLTPNSESIRAAKDALNGWDPTNGCIYYYNPKTAYDKWIFSRTVVTVIGNHRFAK